MVVPPNCGKGGQEKSAITVVKILFLAIDVAIVTLLIMKSDKGRFIMGDDFFDRDVENLNMDDIEKIGDGLDAGAAILGALAALAAGIVAVSKLFSKKDD